MAGKYELKAASGGQFMFNLKAGNSLVILTSETYTTKAAAKNGIESCRKNSSDNKQYERKTARSGKPYFSLLAGNKQVIGKSQMYSSTAAMQGGIASCKKERAVRRRRGPHREEVVWGGLSGLGPSVLRPGVRVKRCGFAVALADGPPLTDRGRAASRRLHPPERPRKACPHGSPKDRGVLAAEGHAGWDPPAGLEARARSGRHDAREAA